MLLSISLYVLAAGLGGAQLAVAVAGAAAAETSARVADQVRALPTGLIYIESF